MKYEILDKNSVIDYLLEIKDVMNYFCDKELEAKEIGDGNLNFVFLVSSIKNPEKALIVKQAVPYLRCIGEDFPLDRKRMTFEIRALIEFSKLASSAIPKLHHTSEDMSVVVMQYLGEHQILRAGLLKQHKYLSFSEQISSYLANTLFYTSSLYLQSTQKRELIDQFNSNTELCKLTEDFVFTFAFMDNETNDNENVKDNKLAKKLFDDMQFKQRVLELKYKFMTQSDCLLHGDLHTGSIMLNDKETFVIDPEFSFVGPFGFDIGALLANLVNNYIHHIIVTENEEYQDWIIKNISDILCMFNHKFLKLWNKEESSALIVDGFINKDSLMKYKENFVKSILRDSVGFAGCKMARRVFGVAGVEDIRGIEDKGLRQKAESMAINIAKDFVLKYNSINEMEDIINIIKDNSAR